MNEKIPVLYLIATAHLDTVYNWELDETVNKLLPDTIDKNFSYFEKYPEYNFCFEGVYRYQLIKEFYPEKYELLKDYIKQGRWIPAGSSWENGDVNIPSPEALIRNYLYGNKFFMKEFGSTTGDIFLPDCFGFSHSLPSIGAHMGLSFFSTAKLIWCADNFKPFDFGKWYGPDGSYLIADLNPCTYISDIEENYQNSDSMYKRLTELPVQKHMRYYGVGDMGGAPREESVINVCNGIKDKDGKIRLVSSYPSQIADELTKEEIDKLPSYDGELVMRTHGVGAYTSRGILKRLNRKNEIIADQSERIGIIADRLGIKQYPYNKLTESWKRVICHQFHDDITGTATERAYHNTINEYFVSLSEFGGELRSACEAICDNISSDCGIDGTPVTLFNSCCFNRHEVVEAIVTDLKLVSGEFTVLDEEQNEVPSQLSNNTDGNKQKVYIYADIPSMGYKTYYIVKKNPNFAGNDAFDVSDSHIENQKYRVNLNNEKNICQIFDKSTGERLLTRPICFEILHNTFSEYGAWEIFYADICSSPDVIKNKAEVEIYESGPVRNVLKITRKYKNSKYTQYLTLDYGSDKILSDYVVDWRETSSLLKLRFTAADRYSTAIYDGGVGVETENNNHEKKYEFAANRWVALKPETGKKSILLMSDCKYGWDKPTDNVLRLTAIHTPNNKRSEQTRQDLQDFGKNCFGTAISLVSAEDFYKVSDEYNYPIIAVQSAIHNGKLPCTLSFASTDNPSVTVRAIKRAEESDDIILRFYNTSEEENHCDFVLPGNTGYVYEADGNEAEKCSIEADGVLHLSFNPYQMKTIGIRNKEKVAYSENVGYHNIVMPCNSVISSSNSDAGSYGFGSENITFPTELMDDGISCCGLDFELGRNGNNDITATICKGQELSVPQNATELYIIGGSLKSDKNTYFSVNGEPYAINAKSIFEPVGKWEQYSIFQSRNVKTDTLAFYASHTHGTKGDLVLQKANLFLYKITLPSGVESVKLPFDSDILLVSAIAKCDKAKGSVLNKELYNI